jgi:hypothetical protein
VTGSLGELLLGSDSLPELDSLLFRLLEQAGPASGNRKRFRRAPEIIFEQ